MEQTENTIDYSSMSVEELEKALKQKKAAELKQREKERQDYESKRDMSVQLMMTNATDLYDAMKTFKDGLHKVFDEHQLKLQEYGGIRSNSKGGFSLVHSNGSLKVSRRRATEPTWDERSDKAVELISDFLRDTVKKKDQKLFEILYGFIQKNEKGDLEYAKVMHLYKHRDAYDDPRWIEGLKLIQESHSINLRGYQYDFKYKDEEGKWQRVEINFSAI